jgi:hypothetical protein
MREAGQALDARKAVNARMKGIEVREGERALSVKNRAPRFGIQMQLRCGDK